MIVKKVMNLDLFVADETEIELTADGEVQISEQLGPSTGQQFIPKIFHRIWIDFGKGKEPTEEYRNLTERLLNMHPGWEFKLWHENEIIEQIKEHVPFFLHTFESYDKRIKKHDSARIIVLHAKGGVYIDHDFIPIKRIEPALGTCKFFSSSEQLGENKYRPTNGIMGSVARNPFLLFAIQAMSLPETASQHVLYATGPIFLENALKAYIRAQRPTGLKIYHPKFFNPFSWSEGSQRIKNYTITEIQSRFPDCIFVQFFQAVWLSEYE